MFVKICGITNIAQEYRSGCNCFRLSKTVVPKGNTTDVIITPAGGGRRMGPGGGGEPAPLKGRIIQAPICMRHYLHLNKRT